MQVSLNNLTQSICAQALICDKQLLSQLN